MYSRFPSHPDPSVQIPKHYSGCAFSPQPPPAPPEPSAPSCAEMPYPPPLLPPPPPPAPQEPQSHASPLSLLGGLLPTPPAGMDFDEMLLLGLILLLSHSEQGSDIILWLALLLFCK